MDPIDTKDDAVNPGESCKPEMTDGGDDDDSVYLGEPCEPAMDGEDGARAVNLSKPRDFRTEGSAFADEPVGFGMDHGDAFDPQNRLDDRLSRRDL